MPFVAQEGFLESIVSTETTGKRWSENDLLEIHGYKRCIDRYHGEMLTRA